MAKGRAGDVQMLERGSASLEQYFTYSPCPAEPVYPGLEREVLDGGKNEMGQKGLKTCLARVPDMKAFEMGQNDYRHWVQLGLPVLDSV